MKIINISKLNNKIKTIKAVGMACMTLSVFFFPDVQIRETDLQ